MSDTEVKQFCQKNTVREMEHKSKIATQKALLELSVLKKIESDKEEIPVEFNIREFFNEYCEDGLSEDKKKAKVFDLLHQNSACFNYIKNLKNKIDDLNNELDNKRETEEYQEEESNRYIQELDEKDIELNNLKLRVTKLREKCIKRNNSLFWWKVLFFTSKTAWLSWFVYKNYASDISAFIF
jgi:hypothetical protein